MVWECSDSHSIIIPRIAVEYFGLVNSRSAVTLPSSCYVVQGHRIGCGTNSMISLARFGIKLFTISWVMHKQKY